MTKQQLKSIITGSTARIMLPGYKNEETLINGADKKLTFHHSIVGCSNELIGKHQYRVYSDRNYPVGWRGFETLDDAIKYYSSIDDN